MPLVATGNQLLNMEQVLAEQVGLGAGMFVADMGCGNGFNALVAAKLVGGKGRVYAVDVLKSCLSTVETEARRHNLLNIKTVWSNVEIFGATKIPEETLDFALLIHTLYQVEASKISDFLKETTRLLKPDGKIAVIDWTRQESPIGPPVDHRISEEVVRKGAQQLPNLQEASSFTPGDYHYGLIYNKIVGTV